MSEVLQTNIFFVITSIAVVVVTVFVAVILYRVIKILKKVEEITERVKRGSEVLAEDVSSIRMQLKSGFAGLLGLVTGRVAKKPRAKKARTQESEGGTSSDTTE